VRRARVGWIGLVLPIGFFLRGIAGKASRELELTMPAPPIERMSRVDRQAIEPDVNAVAAALDLRLGAFVAGIA
jgi:hypothetical protein